MDLKKTDEKTNIMETNIMETTEKTYDWECASGRLIVSDPAYDKDSSDLNLILDAATGTWTSEVEYTFIPGRGKRVAKIISRNKNFDGPITYERFCVRVDSAKMSICDCESYPEEDDICDVFLDKCHFATLNDLQCGIILDGKGFVSRSGFGDGLYDGRIGYDNDGTAVTVEICFLNNFELTRDLKKFVDKSPVWLDVNICDGPEELSEEFIEKERQAWYYNLKPNRDDLNLICFGCGKSIDHRDVKDCLLFIERLRNERERFKECDYYKVFEGISYNKARNVYEIVWST